MAADWSVKGGQATVEGLRPTNRWQVLLNAPQAVGPVNTEKSTVQFAVSYPAKPLIYSCDLREEKSPVQFCTLSEDRCSSSRAVLCQRWFTSARSFCGKVAAGPQKHWPVHRSEAAWCDNSQLSLLVSEPSSQVPRSIVTWKNVGCRFWLSDQHADEETFYLRPRDVAGSGVTYVRTHTHMLVQYQWKRSNIFCNVCNNHQFT